MDYTRIPDEQIIADTVSALQERNFNPIHVNTREEALAKIQELIPAGASVMNGSSRTLEQIGFVEYLKSGQHGWNNLHEEILKEQDPEKQKELRKHAVLSDYYLGSVHALARSGELVIASNSGSQLPHIVFTSPHVIFVVGVQKIVDSLDEARARLQEYVVPLENENSMQKWGGPTMLAKEVILHRENPMWGRTVHVILVHEVLGF